MNGGRQCAVLARLSTRPYRAASFTLRRTGYRLSACARLTLIDGRITTASEVMENPARFNTELTSFLETT